jgi:hypothetical protein
MGPGADTWGYPTERPLSRSPFECYVALYAADRLKVGFIPFLIVGGLYLVTALRKNNNEGHSVY